MMSMDLKVSLKILDMCPVETMNHFFPDYKLASLVTNKLC